MARPKRFEVLTPRFVVRGRTSILLGFSANRTQKGPLRINALAAELQTRIPKRKGQFVQFLEQVFHRRLVSVLPNQLLSRIKSSRAFNWIGASLLNLSLIGCAIRGCPGMHSSGPGR